MLTVSFLLKLLTLPYPIIKTVIQYYTCGTVYQTNEEIRHSLSKNILLSVESYVSGDWNKNDMKTVCYIPIEKVIKKFKKHPLSSLLNNFGEKFDNYSYWIHKSEEPDSTVLIYLHGGGYLLNMFESQFVFITALFYALNNKAAAKISILIVDYSITMFDQVYPTQLYECLTSYNNLVKSGYDKIILLGDSAGSHLSLSIARAIAYPEEVKEQFDGTKFKIGFNIGTLPQPKALLLDAPWVQPCTPPKLPSRHGVSFKGDLGSLDTKMGEFYLGDNNLKKVNNFMTFTNTNWEDHWAKVDPINNGNTLMIVGERETFRDSAEDFYNIVNKNNNIEYYTEPGGIHAGMVYVESLDYASKKGAKKAINGDFRKKYGYNIVANFINDRI